MEPGCGGGFQFCWPPEVSSFCPVPPLRRLNLQRPHGAAQEETLPALATIAGAAATDNHDYEYGLWRFEAIDAKPDSPGVSP